MNENNLIDTRFEMLKEHHTKTLNEAIVNKKVDEQIIPFLQKVALISDIYTSSSCCGRILFLNTDENESKKTSFFVKRCHHFVSESEVLDILSSHTQNYLWLKVEPFIFHFGCKTYDKAKEILDFCRDFGLKKAGIISAKNGRFVCEITNTVYLSTILKVNNDTLISNDYLKFLIEVSNKKLKNNYEKLELFEKEFLKKFS